MKNPWREESKINPQREDGNRQVSNEVWKALMKADLTGAEYKICLCVIHHTWGFGKRYDTISIAQMATETSISSRTVRRTLKSLKEKRIIYFEPSTRVTAGSSLRKKSLNRGSPLNVYLFNKHYDTWKTTGLIGESRVTGLSGLRVTAGSPTKEKTKERDINKIPRSGEGGNKPNRKEIQDSWIELVNQEQIDKWGQIILSPAQINLLVGRNGTRPDIRPGFQAYDVLIAAIRVVPGDVNNPFAYLKTIANDERSVERYIKKARNIEPPDPVKQIGEEIGI